jgi:hypothetical protein
MSNHPLRFRLGALPVIDIGVDSISTDDVCLIQLFGRTLRHHVLSETCGCAPSARSRAIDRDDPQPTCRTGRDCQESRNYDRVPTITTPGAMPLESRHSDTFSILRLVLKYQAFPSGQLPCKNLTDASQRALGTPLQHAPDLLRVCELPHEIARESPPQMAVAQDWV